ncbi:MAG: glutamine synthetase III [Clostridia bacterium]|nr:glutamine synthetase III [Clostridia bacterium]
MEEKLEKVFGSLVFNDEAMKYYLSKETYAEYVQCVENDISLSPSLADRIAKGMMEWATANGCTHFTHWFQPMTGITAEKHDSFISPNGKCSIITEFNGKELIKGEPDASSFPSGGLRATFEARGYTAWDPSSFAFIKDGVLCIPTAFCSYNGAALDKKTPLLRSMQAINKESLALLKMFGKTDVKKVIPNAGPEQEYFLVDRVMYKKRPDLIYTGRTLFGAKSPKGQELDDHYFGAVKLRVIRYMEDLDKELWKVGVFAKTKHNEVAPSQHELACVYSDTNSATDQNQIVMELMRKIASKHGFKCLLHEKPYDGISGSGKHNNWSIATDTGINLFDPGTDPKDNMLFLVLLCSVIRAVDKHQDLLRISVASASNDHRLGKQEAPPAIISIFLGDELMGILDAIAEDRDYSKRAQCEIKIGVTGLPKFRQDTSDRNRTSPFAFTGNKFEFRMPGSKMSIAGINTILNTIVADEIKNSVEFLSNYKDLSKGVVEIIKETINKHKRILFNGNGYSDEWIKEAENRGLLNLPTTMDAVKYMTTKENVDLFARHNVFNIDELKAREGIIIDDYCKKIVIEVRTMVGMVNTLYLPAVSSYMEELAKLNNNLRATGITKFDTTILDKLLTLYSQTIRANDDLNSSLETIEKMASSYEKGNLIKTEVIPKMANLRTLVDNMETITAKKYWPVPSYADLLFSESVLSN